MTPDDLLKRIDVLWDPLRLLPDAPLADHLK